MSNGGGGGGLKYRLGGLKANAAIDSCSFFRYQVRFCVKLKSFLTDCRLECLKIASSKSKTETITENY